MEKKLELAFRLLMLMLGISFMLYFILESKDAILLMFDSLTSGNLDGINEYFLQLIGSIIFFIIGFICFWAGCYWGKFFKKMERGALGSA